MLAEFDNADDTIDLTGKPVLADRVAIGLESLGIAFTRSASSDARGEYGTQITVHDTTELALANRPFRTSNEHAEAEAVRRETREALDGEDLHRSQQTTEFGVDSWRVGESAPPNVLAADIVDAPIDVVAWSNREAQRYTAENVTVTDSSLVIATRTRTTPPSIDELPYESGLAISTGTFGWATITADVTLPVNEGLWPALWLLDAEACQGAGRCNDYESTRYHEIDLLETNGSSPTTVHTTVHWWDGRHRSDTATSVLESGLTQAELRLERRPGLLIWRIDGDVVHVHTGRVDSFDAGPHRSAPMMLIVNTAVGGSFAGTAEIGREGAWLGEALIPPSHPAQLDDIFVVSRLRVEAH